MGLSLPGTYSSSSTNWNVPVGVASNAFTSSNYAQLVYQQQQFVAQQQFVLGGGAGALGVHPNPYPQTGIPSVPPASPRAIAKATITDIYGYTFTIDVDTSVLHYIAAINNTHRPMHATFVNMPKQAPLDADFSLDELERAEKLMEEMSAPV